MWDPIRAVAISISDAPDREKLGFPQREVQRVLFTLCTALIRANYQIVYMGDLRPGGYTLAMFEFLVGTYANRGTIPITNVLPEPVVRKLDFETLRTSAVAAHGIASLVLSVGGELHEVRHIGGELIIGEKRKGRSTVRDPAQFAAWLQIFPLSGRAAGFSQARQIVSTTTRARVLMGGKMGLLAQPEDQYEGVMPGIAEEAILSLEAGRALVPLGAFGGATRDVAIALDLLSEAERAPRGVQLETYFPAMEQLVALREQLPSELTHRLQWLAKNDQAEELAQEVLKILHVWEGA